jgi:hypothetical protein
MPISFTWPTSQDEEVVDAIRTAIGRDVTFYIVASSTPCTEPTCFLDPVTNTSTNSFCSVCSGNYYIPVYSGVDVSAHVTWGYSEQLGWRTGGQLDEGECRVQIKYTPANVTIIDNMVWAEVDGRVVEKVKTIYRGVQTLNRILLDLKEKEYN